MLQFSVTMFMISNVFISASSIEVMDKEKSELEAAGVSCFTEHLPGDNVIQSVSSAIHDSDVILVLITKNPGEQSKQNVKMVCTSDSKTIIPIFYGVSPDKADNLLQTPAFMRLSLLRHVMYDEPGSMERVICAIKEPEISES